MILGALSSRRTKHPHPETSWPTRAEAQASLLFQPIQVGAFEARTRTWVPAMVPWRSTSEGFVTQDVLDWYGRFADGKPGVLVVEATGIREVPSGPLLRIGDDRFLPGLRELVEVVRQRSEGATKLLIQIIDFVSIRRRPEKERYLSEFLVLRDEHRAEFSGSDDEVRAALIAMPHADLLELLDEREAEALESGARERIWDTQLPHIAELPAVLPGLFADAAERAIRAGFDGVELHYAHAYTMASFLSRLNDRSDGYGGSREGRARLPLEVLAAVRARIGADQTLGCRLLGDEVVAGGSRVTDAAYYSTEIARAGADFVSVSKGGKFEDARQPKVGEAAYPYTGPSGHECMPTIYIEGAPPFGRNLPEARTIRDAIRAAGLNTPVIAAGGVQSFELAESALREGSCDLVGAARQSLADPDWWLKMELGHGAEVRACKFTNYCEALDQRHEQVTCQLWGRDFAQPDPGHSSHIARSLDGKRRLVAPPWQRTGK